jgi:hypothetical protein
MATRMKTTVTPEVAVPKRPVPPEAVKRKPPPPRPPENVCARCGAIAPDFPADGRLYCSPTCLELERRGVPHGE